MTTGTSFISHRTARGSRMFAVLSLGSLASLTAAQAATLDALGIRTLADLLHWLPVHRARLLMAVHQGLVAHDFDLARVLRDGADRDPATFPTASTSLVDGIGLATEQTLRDMFRVRTVADLAAFAPFVEAERMLADQADAFREPASAPDDLVPTVAGAVASVARLSSIVREDELEYLRSFSVPKDDPLSNVLVSGRPLQLGYVALHVQRWVHLGVHLGEVVHTVALAPGESRQIAVLDWRRRQIDTRVEGTAGEEVLTSALSQGRTLDDVVSAVAREHQWGGSLALSATNVAAIGGVSALAATFGAATAVGGAVTLGASGAGLGAVIGGAAGTAVPGVGNVLGAILGGLVGGASGVVVGAVAGGAAGALSGAALASAVGAAGVMLSDSSGVRSILADERQNIMQLTGQKSSLARSLRSTVVMESSQAESATARTQQVANHNHSHSLNLCYYEILQRYRVDLRTERLEPFLLLPYGALDFTLDMIVAYWDVLREAIQEPELVSAVDALVATGLPLVEPDVASADAGARFENIEVTVIRGSVVDAPPSRVGFMHTGDSSLRDLTHISGSGTPVTKDTYADRSTPGLPIQAIRQVAVSIPHHADVRYRATIQNIRIRTSTNHVIQIPGQIELPWQEVGTGQPTTITWDADVFAFVRSKEQAQHHLGNVLETVQKRIRARRYLFTRLLLASIEREQLADVLDQVQLTSGTGTVPLREVVDLVPIGMSPHGLLLRLRPNRDLPDRFAAIRDYPAQLAGWLAGQEGKGATTLSDDVYLPSSGVFTEAVLGRSNASEKIDLTRFWNWQDSPIPQAPAIAPIDTASRAEEPASTQPSPFTNVLNVVPPVQFPEAQGLGQILQAVAQGSMFRDMSRGAELGALMSSLASVAERAALGAVTQAGTAATESLGRALALAEKVADLSQHMADASTSKLATPENITHEGGRENLAESKPQQPAPPSEPSGTNAPPATGTPEPPAPPRPRTRSARNVPVILSARWGSNALLEADFDLELVHDVTNVQRVLGFRTGQSADSTAGHAAQNLTNPELGDWSVVGNARVWRPADGLIHNVSVPTVGGDHLEIVVDLTRDLTDQPWMNVEGSFLLTSDMQTVRLKAVAETEVVTIDQSITLQASAGGELSAEIEGKLKHALLAVLGGQVGVTVGLSFNGEVGASQTTSYKITYQKLRAITLVQTNATN